MIDVITLEGSASVRGLRLGNSRAAGIKAWIRDWLGSLRDAGIGDPNAYVAHFLQETNYLEAIRAHTPDLLEEVSATADAAGLPFNILLGGQFMDEEWAFREAYLSKTVAREKCSSLAVAREGAPTWIGQNMDLGRYTDGHQILLRIAPDEGPDALIFSLVGMIALMGVNSQGVGVCVNALPILPHRSAGLPVAFVIRKILQARSGAEAAALIRDLPHATGQHYLIAEAGRIWSYEASPDQVLEYHAPDPTRVLHTNHPLVGDAARQGANDFGQSTLERLDSLSRRLGSGEPDLDDLKAALSACDHPDFPVSRGSRVANQEGQTGFTTGSMVSELPSRPGSIRSWVSAGPPDERGYAELSIENGLLEA
jgi:hypothetical protein